MAGASFAAGLALLPAPAGKPTEIGLLPWWDLPARGLAAMALVVALTAASGSLGPNLSGLLAPFPVITSVLAVVHPRSRWLRTGARPAAEFLVGF